MIKLHMHIPDNNRDLVLEALVFDDQQARTIWNYFNEQGVKTDLITEVEHVEQWRGGLSD